MTSRDGTALRGWSNDADGLPVVLSNGLGALPSAWPGLTGPTSNYAVHTWFHRGTFGSDRPADLRRVRVEDHVDDLVALMDARGIERALVACWSIGVNIGFELALRHPSRVAGLLGVAGVPGGTFSTVGGPLRVPRRLRRPLVTGLARTAVSAGPLLNQLLHHLPVDARVAWLASHSGFMLPGAPAEVLAPMLHEFVQQDWGWYFRLALGADAHAPMDLSDLRCPVSLLAGRYDLLTSVDDVRAIAASLPHATLTVLPGSHFLPLEHPKSVTCALDELAARSDLSTG